MNANLLNKSLSIFTSSALDFYSFQVYVYFLCKKTRVNTY